MGMAKSCYDSGMQPMHFIDEPIEVLFASPPALEKKPECPNGFVWRGETYRIVAMLAEWFNFERRGKMAKNMRPAHADRASLHGSWNEIKRGPTAAAPGGHPSK